MKKNIIHSDRWLVASLIIFITGLTLFSIGAGARLFAKNEARHCSEEARLCPDGSTVVRSGPACTFAPCQMTPPVETGLTEEPIMTIVEPEKTPPKKEEPKNIPPEDPQKEVACTQDAKMCPDGSFVGRVAPKCAFAPCPVSKDISNGSGSMSL